MIIANTRVKSVSRTRRFWTGSLIVWFVVSNAAIAGPRGGEIVGGEGSISQGNLNTRIDQNSSRLAIEWDSFNVAANESVQFNQPDASSVALNRILDHNPSEIFGAIDANGRVFLVNPNGMIFGANSRINVAGLLASSAGIRTEDFMAGNYEFSTAEGEGGLIHNQGVIQAADGGFVVMIGDAVLNEGAIIAELGSIDLAAGRSATLDFRGDGLLLFEVGAEVTENVAAVSDGVKNTGELIADGGRILMTAASARDIYSQAVNNEGLVRAQRIENSGGVIRLVGSNGDAINTGTLDASAGDGVSNGGLVQVLGEHVGLAGNALVDVSGGTDGGLIQIGGAYQGNDPDVANASRTFVGSDVTILADAGASGQGGEVIVWSDEITRFAGDISAGGGSVSGDGGLVEVSGKQDLQFTGSVNTSAAAGDNGLLLLDPETILIEGCDPACAASTDGDGTINFADAPAAGQATINETDLEALNTNILLQATSGISTGNTGANTGFLLNNIALIPGNSLTLQTRNNAGAATTDGVAGINLTTTGGGAAPQLVLINGSLTIQTGVDADAAGVVSNTDGDAANVVLGSILVTDLLDDGIQTDVTISSSGSIVTDTITISDNSTAANEGGDLSLVTRAANGTTIQIGGALNVATTGASEGGEITINSNGLATQTATITADGLELLGAGGFTLGLANDVDLLAADTTAAVTYTDTDEVEIGTVSGTAGIDANQLILTANGITQSSSVTVATTTTLDGGATGITLANASNDFGGAVSVASGAGATLVGANTIELGDGTITGLLDVTADAITVTGAVGAGSLDFDASGGAGDITDTTGDLTVSGTSLLTAGAANNVVLDAGTNDFGGAVSVASAATATLVDTNSIVLGAGSVTGLLDVTADAITVNGAVGAGSLDFDVTGGAGNITDSGAGALTVAGASAIALAAGDDVVLDGTNTFTGAVTFAGATTSDITLVDSSAYDVQAGGLTVNLLDITAAGITQSDALTVATTTTLDSGAGAIDLSNAANDFGGAVSANSGSTATLVDANTITLGDGAVTGLLDVTADAITVTGAVSAGSLDFDVSGGAGNVTDSGLGALTVTGTSLLTAGAANNVTLDAGTNDFGGAVSVASAANATLADANTIQLGAGAVTGLLDVTANAITVTGAVSAGAVDFDVTGGAGNITDSGAGALTVAGASAIALAAGDDVVLDGANTFTGAVTFAGATTSDITLVDSSAYDVQAGGLTVNLLDITAAGITQSDALTVATTTTLDSGAGAIDLSNAANDFGGAVSTNSGSTATLVDANTITLGAGTVTGLLDVTADAITVTGAVVAGSVTGSARGSATIAAGGSVSTTVGDLNLRVDSDDNSAESLSVLGTLSSAGATLLAGSAGNANDTLVGPDTVSAWTIDTATTGTLNLAPWANFLNLTGGSAVDTFTINGGSLGGTINGGLGLDFLVGDASYTVNAPDQGTSSSVTLWTSIENLTGTGAADTFIFNNVLTGTASGLGGNDLFDILTGGDAAAFDGGTGTDTQTYQNSVGPVVIAIADLTSIEILVGSTSAADTLQGTSGDDSFVIAGVGAGSVGGVDYSSFENLDGLGEGATGDTLSGDTAYAITGTNGGTSTSTTTWTDIENLIGTAADDTFTINGGTLSGTVDGLAGNDVLAGDTSYEITGTDEGTSGSVGLWTSIESLTGTLNPDTFTVNGGSLSGTANGLGGADTLAGDSSYEITGVDQGTSGAINLWTLIENLTGTANPDTFTVNGGSLSGTASGLGGSDTLSGDVSYDIATADAGSSGSVGLWTGIENLTGTAGDDTFTFAAGSSLSGIINGLGHTVGDSADYSGLVGPQTVVLSADVVNVELLTGGGVGFTIEGGSSWVIGGVGDNSDDGTVDGTISFIDWANLTGTAADDVFTVNGGSLSGAVDGLGGSNTLAGDTSYDITSADEGTSQSVNLWTSIQNLTGSAASDTFTIAGGTLSGTAAGAGGTGDTLSGDSSYTITGADSGTSGAVAAWIGIENLTGSAANDTFTVAGGTLSGTAAGAGGTGDTLSGDSSYTITGADSGTSGAIAAWNGVENLTGSLANDTFMVAGGTLSGTADGAGGTGDTLSGDSTYSITGANSGVSGAVTAWANIENLTGSAAADTFTVDGGTLSGTADGAAGSDTLAGDSGYTVTGANSGTGTAVAAFQNIESLVGNSGANVFLINNGASLAGSIDGGAGDDTLDLSGFASPRVVALTGDDASGFSGTEASVAGGFSGVDRLSGTGSDRLTSSAAATNWSVADVSQLTTGGGNLTFTGFNDLVGGSGANLVDFSGNMTLANLNLSNIAEVSQSAGVLSIGNLAIASSNGVNLSQDNQLGTVSVANSSSGLVRVRNDGALTVTSIENLNGDIELDTSGTMTIGLLRSDGNFTLLASNAATGAAIQAIGLGEAILRGSEASIAALTATGPIGAGANGPIVFEGFAKQAFANGDQPIVLSFFSFASVVTNGSPFENTLGGEIVDPGAEAIAAGTQADAANREDSTDVDWAAYSEDIELFAVNNEGVQLPEDQRLDEFARLQQEMEEARKAFETQMVDAGGED